MPAPNTDPDDEEVTINGADGTQRASGKRGADEPEIEIVDDTPVEDRGRKPLGRTVEDPDEEELAQYSAGVKSRISELTHARHDERRAREAAERERDEAVRASQNLLAQNRALAQRTTEGETHLIAASKEAATVELESAKAALLAAKEAFDTEAEMKAQDRLLDAKIRLREIAAFKPAPVQQPEEVVQLAPVEPPEAPVDQKTLRWQARNQWFGAEGNEEITSFALGFHQKLVKSGVDPRSDEYFQKVDEKLHGTFPEFFGSNVREVPDDRSSQRNGAPRTSPVASATRQANGVTKVRLTPTQVALAKKFGLTPLQYAQEVARLEQK